MPKYEVEFQTTASAVVEVEADDEDAALDAAYDEIPAEVCAQCSGWGRSWSLELSEWELIKDQPDGPYPIKAVRVIGDDDAG